MSNRFYCPMCERFVQLHRLAMDVLPPANSEARPQAIYSASEVRYRYSHLTCGEVVEDLGAVPDIAAIFGAIPDLPGVYTTPPECLAGEDKDNNA